MPEECDDGLSVTKTCSYGETACADCAKHPGVVVGYRGDGVVNDALPLYSGKSASERPDWQSAAARITFIQVLWEQERNDQACGSAG
jgi:hypothetical protein